MHYLGLRDCRPQGELALSHKKPIIDNKGGMADYNGIAGELT